MYNSRKFSYRETRQNIILTVEKLAASRRQADTVSRNRQIVVAVGTGKIQNMDPWSMDPSVDQVHQNIDRVHGPPIFPTPKNRKQ